MSYRADIGVYDAFDRLVLAVEVKGLTGKAPEWAAELRRDIYARGVLKAPEFFLLALPDRFFLWKSPGRPSDAALPDYEIDAKRLLAPYYSRSRVTAEAVVGRALELIVSSWLQDLMSRDEPPTDALWARDSGLFGALKGGHVEYEVAA